ncbi:MAG: S-methyl-5-thioribose-1-phosphate isomerase [Gemmatimonadota bacterium]|nr:S-methyl-5-thioribose-1-phosphate isomerase [Gemmatimonadota bacterium]
MELVQAVRWSDDGTGVRIIDQRHLPGRVVERELRSVEEVCDAIATLAVRGAPAIGVAGAMGLVASLVPHAGEPADRLLSLATEYGARIRAARPTAVNLPWAIDRVLGAMRSAGPAESAILLERLRAEATAILEEDRAMCRRIGEHGLALIPDGARVLTHCNAGALATAGIGTALAPLYLAALEGRRVEVFVGETRPLLQGSRLTAWELSRVAIPVTVLADDAAAALMRAGAIDLCIVGADRIAANGDVANKIGTYALAIAARYHDLPFYVAAPTSTFDAATHSGADIAVEERAADEIRCGFGPPTAPQGARIRNPAFDVTPAALVTAIISDRGVHRPPYRFAEGGGPSVAGRESSAVSTLRPPPSTLGS